MRSLPGKVSRKGGRGDGDREGACLAVTWVPESRCACGLRGSPPQPNLPIQNPICMHHPHPWWSIHLPFHQCLWGKGKKYLSRPDMNLTSKQVLLCPVVWVLTFDNTKRAGGNAEVMHCKTSVLGGETLVMKNKQRKKHESYHESYLPKRGMQTHFSVLLIPPSCPSLLFPLSFLLSSVSSSSFIIFFIPLLFLLSLLSLSLCEWDRVSC